MIFEELVIFIRIQGKDLLFFWSMICYINLAHIVLKLLVFSESDILSNLILKLLSLLFVSSDFLKSLSHLYSLESKSEVPLEVHLLFFLFLIVRRSQKFLSPPWLMSQVTGIPEISRVLIDDNILVVD